TSTTQTYTLSLHDALPISGTYPVAEDPERIHLAVEEHLRGDGHPVPLRAVVFLREAEGTCRMERLMPQEVLPDLWTLSFKLPTRSEEHTSELQSRSDLVCR